MINLKHIASKVFSIRTKEAGASLSEQKSVLILTRITIISSTIMAFYMFITLFMGLYIHAFLCAINLPFFYGVFRLIKTGKYEVAKILYSILILFLIALFAISFGPGIGSEYWITVVGGISLLVFNDVSKSLKMVIIAILTFVSIKILQEYIEPVFILDESLLPIIYRSNVVFMFITFYLVSFILRYSSEDFESHIRLSNRILQRQNKDLTDSINYSKRIQEAVLPSSMLSTDLVKNAFVTFEPKDIVSGDFFWFHNIQDRLLFAVVDGSGHGVTGALNSITVHTLLNQCVEEYGLINVKDIIGRLKLMLNERILQWNDQFADQLEITLCSFSWSKKDLEIITNGNNTLIIKHIDNIKKDEEFHVQSEDRYGMREVRFSNTFKSPSVIEDEFLYQSHTIEKDDMLYLYTKGFANQFGGPKGKKFKSDRLKNLLMSVQHLNLNKQKYIIEDVLKNWRGKHVRTEDITLLGFKI